MTDTLTSFLQDLAAYQTLHSTNLYLSCASANCHAQQRKINIELYLSHFLQKGCQTLLIGEAPGYKGCRVTGIPFTSENIIENNSIFRRDFQAISNQYVTCLESGATKKEGSSTSVWSSLEKINPSQLPCCWNIFPLHPFNLKQEIWSNRTPTKQEIAGGADFTLRLIALLKPRQIIAVGNKSHLKLQQIGISANKVCHPSYGHGAEFHFALLNCMTDNITTEGKQ